MSKIKDYLSVILNTQMDVNRLLIPHVSSAKASDFRIALSVEIGELISMLPYKWWETEKTIDKHQVLLEICDIWAFAISFSQVDRSDYSYRIRSNFVEIIGEFAEALEPQQFDYKALIETANSLFDHFCFAKLVDLIAFSGADFYQFYVFYTAKSELNKFRHRQRSFTKYSKQWGNLTDNQVLANIAEKACEKELRFSALVIYIKTKIHEEYRKYNNV